MKTLKRFGFFDELAPEDAQRYIRGLCTVQPCRDKDMVLRYLKAGVLFLIVPGVARDMCDVGGKIIGSPDVLTDGVWAWTADVPYYVEKYNLTIPAELWERIHLQNGDVPPVADLEKLELRV